MFCSTKSPLQRRYRHRVVVAFVLYFWLQTATIVGFVHFHPIGLAAFLLAVLPALPVIGVIVIAGLHLANEKDEFVRSFKLESMLWGIGSTLAVTTVWGSLENWAHVQRLDLLLIFPIYCVSVGLASVLVKRRYR